MSRYVIWKEARGFLPLKDFILDIFDNKADAINKYAYIEETEENINLLMDGWSGNSDEIYITKIEIDNNTNELYFIKIYEDEGGGSYGGTTWLYVEFGFEESLEYITDYFYDEHNKCKKCKKCPDKCLNKLISRLKEHNTAEFKRNTKYAFCEIYSVKL